MSFWKSFFCKQSVEVKIHHKGNIPSHFKTTNQKKKPLSALTKSGFLFLKNVEQP